MGKSKSTNKMAVNETLASENQAVQTGTVVVDAVEASAETDESINDTESAEETEPLETADNDEFVTTSAYVDRIEETENGNNRIVLYTDDEDNPEKFVLPASMVPQNIKPDDSVIVKIAYLK